MSHSKRVRVVTEAVENEGKKWNGLSDMLASVKSAVDDLSLDESAFYIGPQSLADAAINSSSYNSFRAYISELLKGGVTEFDELGEALKKIAKHYDRTDQINAVDLKGIFY